MWQEGPTILGEEQLIMLRNKAADRLLERYISLDIK